MRRMRTRLLLGAIACLVLAAPLAAQVAPTVTGETGLFQVTNADMLPQGRFSLGLSWGLWNRTAASVPYAAPLPDDPLRYDLQRFGLSVGYGLMPNWEATMSTGSNRYHASNFDWQGLVNGHYRFGGFTHSETDKVRIGTKIRLNSKDPVLVALFGGISIPTQSKNDVNAIGTTRADYDLGLSFTFGWVTFQTAYQLNGKIGTPTPFPNTGPTGYDLSNVWTNAVGVAVPVVPNVFKAIGEINRVHYDGGDTQPPDFSEATARRAIRIRRLRLHGVRRRAREHRPLGEIRKHSLEHRRPRSGRLPAARSGRGEASRRPAPRSRARRAAGHGARAAASRSGSRARRAARGRAVTAARGPAFHLDDRRDPLRRRQEPPHEHREGHPGRRRPPPEEQPRRDVHDLGLHRPEGEGRGSRRARQGPRRSGHAITS